MPKTVVFKMNSAIYIFVILLISSTGADDCFPLKLRQKIVTSAGHKKLVFDQNSSINACKTCYSPDKWSASSFLHDPEICQNVLQPRRGRLEIDMEKFCHCALYIETIESLVSTEIETDTTIRETEPNLTTTEIEPVPATMMTAPPPDPPTTETETNLATTEIEAVPTTKMIAPPPDPTTTETEPIFTTTEIEAIPMTMMTAPPPDPTRRETEPNLTTEDTEPAPSIMMTMILPTTEPTTTTTPAFTPLRHVHAPEKIVPTRTTTLPPDHITTETEPVYKTTKILLPIPTDKEKKTHSSSPPTEESPGSKVNCNSEHENTNSDMGVIVILLSSLALAFAVIAFAIALYKCKKQGSYAVNSPTSTDLEMGYSS